MKKYLIITFCLIGILSVGLKAQIPSYVPKDSLVAWWPFNGNADDESGNGNHGNIVNSLNDTTDRFGNKQSALSFDGSGYITVFKLNNLLYKPMSYSGWLKVSNYLGGNGGFNCKSIIGRNRGFVQNCGEICLASDDGKFSNELTFWRGGGASTLTNAAKSVHLDSWIHFVFTHDTNGDFRWFINGELTNFGNFTNDLSYYADFMIGSDNNNTGSSANWDGLLDDMGIWNRVLDSNEIKALYESKNCTLTFTREPQGQSSFSGNISFTVSTTDSTANYQWQTNQGTGWLNLSNAGQYSGVTTDSLIVKNVTISNDGQLFRCIAIGNCGIDTTREAKLSVWGVRTNQIHKPRFTLHPNPVAQQIQILGLNENEFKYEIYSITGILFSKGVSAGTINVSKLSAGVYLLGVNGQNVKFIKE